jgi:hypothetical protein
MQDSKLEKVGSSSEGKSVVYIIMRVYNLGQESVGVHVYCDSAALEEEQTLSFTATSYTVNGRH